MDAPSDEETRAVYAAFGTAGRLESEFVHPDLEWHNDPEFPGGSVHVLTLHDGKIAKVEAFTDRGRGRVAAGLAGG